MSHIATTLLSKSSSLPQPSLSPTPSHDGAEFFFFVAVSPSLTLGQHFGNEFELGHRRAIGGRFVAANEALDVLEKTSYFRQLVANVCGHYSPPLQKKN
ncbi:hypothetical protein HPB50_025770 [Hyalomma asiaticum]|uniref:Uncharacterized protein n=1 Tax=Hyalomma asiaticum TaxID=266040 RepID=A0ACB7RPH7_HYAAI|nr:hypothetical protein HPB50_025770 [Hyalomma asiaticum]